MVVAICTLVLRVPLLISHFHLILTWIHFQRKSEVIRIETVEIFLKRMLTHQKGMVIELHYAFTFRFMLNQVFNSFWRVHHLLYLQEVQSVQTKKIIISFKRD